MKTCSKCFETKSLDQFHRQARVSDGRQSICKGCRKTLDASIYRQKKFRRKAQLYALRIERRNWNEELKSKPCTDCGVLYPYYVMHWDHLDSRLKTTEVSKLISNAYGKRKILEEIAKCELVCANCHAERTHRRKRAVA